MEFGVHHQINNLSDLRELTASLPDDTHIALITGDDPTDIQDGITLSIRAVHHDNHGRMTRVTYRKAGRDNTFLTLCAE